MPKQTGPVTTWVRPTERTTGQDHLGVLAISEHISAELIPGLTSQTQRIANYSFYPWFFWAYEREIGGSDPERILDFLRRAECTLVLAASMHAIEEGDDREHSEGLPGVRLLRQAAERIAHGERLSLSQLAHGDDEERAYLKEEYGGLGQYYLSPLRQVGVLGGEARDDIRYTLERGGPLATLLDARVDRESFFRFLGRDRVDRKGLNGLAAFCPCRLRKNSGERTALRTLLLNDPSSAFADDFGLPRRRSIGLLLDVAHALPSGDAEEGTPPLVPAFHDAVYSGVLPGGQPWALTGEQELARQRWAASLRHDLLSVAVQVLFQAGLSDLLDGGGRLPTAESYGKWFSSRFARSLPGPPGRSFRDHVAAFRPSLAPLSRYEDAGHELRAMERALVAVQGGERRAAVRESLKILSALAARDEEVAPYADIPFQQGYFDSYEINLLTFRARAAGPWSGMALGEWLTRLGTEWGVLAHLRIALRKLHRDSLDTFRIIPTERGLQVVEAPDVTWSYPRLWQLVRAMVHLDLLDSDLRPTKAGDAAREAIHAGA